MVNSDKDGTIRMPEAAERFVQDVLGRIKAKEMKPEIEAEARIISCPEWKSIRTVEGMRTKRRMKPSAKWEHPPL